MFWHIDTDIISLLVIAALFAYCAQATLKNKDDLQAHTFLLCLFVGVIATIVDIAASVIMEFPVNRYLYHTLMILYFICLELTIVCWFRYCLVVLYYDHEKFRKRATYIVGISYLCYVLFVLSNPWTGVIYTLGVNNEYQRGPLFFLMLALYIVYVAAILVLMVRRYRYLPAGYPGYVLLLTPMIVAASIAAQLMNEGWLMILPGYSISVLLAFLFLQIRRRKMRESYEQMGQIMNNINGGVCAAKVEDNGEVQILLANDDYYAIHGFTKEQYEAEQKSPLEVILTPDRKKVKDLLQKVAAESEPAVFEYRCQKKNGSICTVRCQISITAIVGMGDKVLLAAMTDITDLKAAEEAALVHGEEMRIAMAQMGKIICEFSFDRQSLTVPEIYAHRYGIPTEFGDIPHNEERKATIHPAYWEIYLDFYRAICRGDAGGSVELRTKWKDGSSHWEHGEFSTVFDSTGRPVKAVIAVEDTTDLHRRYELEQNRPTLGEENLLAHALFNLNTGETLDYSYRDGREVPVDKRISFTFGGENLEDVIINDEEREKFRIFNDRDKLFECFARGETELVVDYRRKMADDEVIWVRNILRMIREPGGNDILLFEYCYNIEKEKIFELMCSALVNENFDFVGRINGKNRHYSILTGRNLREAMPPLDGKDMDEMVRNVAVAHTHPDDRQSLLENLTVNNIIRNLETKDRHEFTFRLMLKDGGLRYKAVSMYYLDRERQIIIITREDVSGAIEEEIRKNQTLSKALAAAEQASVAKSRFLSRMSHELRTPMNVILGTTALTNIDEDTPPQIQEASRTITASARYLLSLINDILEISRIESGELTLATTPFELQQMLSEVNDLIKPLVKVKGLYYEVIVRGGTAPVYIGDQTKLKQILINVLSNAVKFTPAEGRIVLDIEQRSLRNDRAVVCFKVIDSGIGIDKAFIPRLFDMFAQESVENTTTVTGTGLGLPIAKSFAELMDGNISVESVQGEGSTFIIEVQLGAGEKTCLVPSSTRGEIPDLSGKRLLMAEDNVMNAMILQQMLKKVGAEVVSANNGKVALEVFKKNPVGFFDAILMDIRMPVMDGLAAATNIRGSEKPDGRRIPIIAVSANAFDDDVAQAKECGMNAYIAKPIEPMLLFTTLAKLIK